MLWRRVISRSSRPFSTVALALLLTLTGAVFGRPSLAQTPGPTPTRIYLPLVMRDFSRPPSEQLIADALARGEISGETALVYKVYATFGDPSLPVQYRGNDKGTIDSPILDKVTSDWSSLSPQTQALLKPFFIPPAYEGSWAQALALADLKSGRGQSLQNPVSPAPAAVPTILPREGWTNLSRPNGRVKVWWRTADAAGRTNAEKVLAAVEDKAAIWDSLTGLLGVEPPSDAGVTTEGNGDDGLYDIYIYEYPRLAEYGDYGAKAVNIGYLDPAERPNCHSPSFIIVRPQFTTSDVLTHEVMHAFQKWYAMRGDCTEYKWLREATAEWAVDYVYPTSIGNPEQARLADYFSAPETALEDVGGQTPYAHYLFYFYLAGQDRRNASRVRQVLFNTQVAADSLEAVEDTLQQAGLGGFAAVWPEFALYNWNRDAWNFYQQWDDIQGGMMARDVPDTLPGRDSKGPFDHVRLGGASQKELKLDAKVGHLAARYYRLKFDDDTVRSAVLVNPFWNGSAASDATMSVQLLSKIKGGDWQWQNLTNAPGKSFCRNTAAEEVEEMVVIVSNTEWKNRDDYGLPNRSVLLKINQGGCWPPVKQLVINPRSVIGGATSSGTVTLADTAPPGGVRVFIKSEDPAVAGVTGQVTVPEGATAVDFPIYTNPVQADTFVFIYAFQTGETGDTSGVSDQIAVRQPKLVLFAIPGRLKGGESFKGTVGTLGNTPAGGIVVSLRLNSPADYLLVPGTVSIPEGASSAEFEGSAGNVKSEVTGQVTASYGGTILVANTIISP